MAVERVGVVPNLRTSFAYTSIIGQDTVSGFIHFYSLLNNSLFAVPFPSIQLLRPFETYYYVLISNQYLSYTTLIIVPLKGRNSRKNTPIVPQSFIRDKGWRLRALVPARFIERRIA